VGGVGYDLVAHCVGDILVHGARPLFFLDYIGAGRLEPDVVERVVAGLVQGCQEAGCALIGGETAEMPGVYPDGEIDLVGCIVGEVARDNLVDGSRCEVGDRLLGLRSAGLHTNGFSLARRIVLDEAGLGPQDLLSGTGQSVAEALLARHRLYLPLLDGLIERLPVNGMSHITGGGIGENLPRVFPPGLGACVDRSSWEVPDLFRALQRIGSIETDEMFSVFNMGIGFVLVVPEGSESDWSSALRARGESPIPLGRVEEGEHRVRWSEG